MTYNSIYSWHLLILNVIAIFLSWLLPQYPGRWFQTGELLAVSIDNIKPVDSYNLENRDQC